MGGSGGRSGLAISNRGRAGLGRPAALAGACAASGSFRRGGISVQALQRPYTGVLLPGLSARAAIASVWHGRIGVVDQGGSNWNFTIFTQAATN